MTRTFLGWLLTAIGALVIALSVFADPIGLGSEGTSFGWKQVVGVVAGALVLAAGAGLIVRGRAGGGPESPASAP